MRTARLILHRRREEDREPFAVLNADPLVMEFLPEPLDRAASDELVERIESGFDRPGFGLWPVDIDGAADSALPTQTRRVADSGRASRRRQRERDASSAAGTVLGPDPTALRLDEAAGDREAESGAAR